MERRDFIVMQFCENNDLFEFLEKYVENQHKQGAVKSEGQGMIVKDLLMMQFICRQLLEGLDALHNQAQIAHMDIKLENILIG